VTDGPGAADSAPVSATQSTSSAASVRTVAATLVALTLSVMPAFLLGGIAVLVRRDLGFSEAGLGAAIAVFYTASTVAAVPGGHLAERLGGLRASGIGVLISSAALLGIALLANSWRQLVLFQAIGGLANALIQPATNLALARAVPLRRQGLAFGLKQTNGPIATFVAGISVPLIGLTLGWRWAFALMAVTGLAFFVVRPPTRLGSPPPPQPSPRGDSPTSPLVLTAVGCGFGIAAAASLIGFYVESAVASGHPVAHAGWWFAAGSVVGTVARIAWGWVADRRAARGLGLISGLLVSGAVGFALLGASSSAAVLAVATALAFAAGWGWFGLIFFAVVQVSPTAPARATGIVLAGVSAGGIVGPPLFGFVVERSGYGLAWAGTAAGLLVAAAFIATGEWLRTR
jgi:MFS family permease